MEGANAGVRTFGTAAGRGAFVLFEGVDRCGKTTQVGMLKEHFAKTKDVEQIRFPERKSAVGQLIDSYLQSNSNLNDQSIHLLFSANRWEQSDSIESKLGQGCSLVSLSAKPPAYIRHTMITQRLHCFL
jgi:dTMP kinase